MKCKVLDGIERLLARASKRVVSFVDDDSKISVKACSTVRSAPCPDCQRWSHRRHGSRVRCLAERPSLEQQVVIVVQIHRFKCSSTDCPRRTFAEDIQSLAGRHQRRTRSQARALQALGHALGGTAAARLAENLGIHASADTVLREVRRAGVCKQRVPPQVVGIDDWAIARGHHYGTVVVDLERREPIEVFAGRESTAVYDWLRANPSIRIVARDRAGAYSEAAEIALPAAQQVSDRWHLLGNLRDTVERMLHRLGPQLRQAAQQVECGSIPLGRQGLPRGIALRGWQRLSDDRRAARLARYEAAMALHAQGRTMQGIARELSIDQRTVRKFVTAQAFPERTRRTRGPTPLDAHRGYIEERILQGCHSPRRVWKEVRERGYTGSHSAVRDCVLRLLRPQGKDPRIKQTARTMACPSPRRVFGWLAGWKKLNPDQPRGDDHERCRHCARSSLRWMWYAALYDSSSA